MSGPCEAAEDRRGDPAQHAARPFSVVQRPSLPGLVPTGHRALGARIVDPSAPRYTRRCRYATGRYVRALPKSVMKSESDAVLRPDDMVTYLRNFHEPDRNPVAMEHGKIRLAHEIRGLGALFEVKIGRLRRGIGEDLAHSAMKTMNWHGPTPPTPRPGKTTHPARCAASNWRSLKR